MKKIFLGLLACGLPMIAEAQETFDALQMSQTELRGTARFQSMAGAFGALGGDLSTLNQNPAGIGVYRSSDAGITLSLDFNSNKTPNLLADDKSDPQEIMETFNCSKKDFKKAIGSLYKQKKVILDKESTRLV